MFRFALFLGVTTGLFAQGQLTVTVLHFKTHGLAVVLKTPAGKTWLIDTALRPKDNYYAARDVIAPFLRQAGVKALDGVLMAAATKPKFVVVASLREYLNPLIRPYELTKGAFELAGSTVYATWVHGDITAVSDGKTVKASVQRESEPWPEPAKVVK